jgi:D-glycero-alpha-D-manno-heptose-7-phosphate kinase
MKFIAKSPTRIDLAGGTLDCWPLFNLVGDAVTVNVSIDIWTHASLSPVDSHVEIVVEDLNFRHKFASLAEFFASGAKEIALIQTIARFFNVQSGFQLITRSESPLGGGLGASSSLCISLLKVFSQWQGLAMTVHQAVEVAHNLEARLLNKPTGKQDYVPAWEKGCYALHFDAWGLRPEKLNVDVEQLAPRLILVYTGQPHHSGLNNWQVIKAAVESDTTTLKALRDLRSISYQTLETLRARDWKALAGLFRAELDARLCLSSAFSSPEILRLQRVAEGAGAEAVKICGAGGGGCVFLWASPERRQSVVQACETAGFKVLSARPIA